VSFGLRTGSLFHEAEVRIADLTYQQHIRLYLFKKRLLRVLDKRRRERPEFGLFYVRTMVEIHLHMFMAEDYKGIAQQLPSAIQFLLCYKVNA
jgi:hypothetical protein